MHTHQVEVEAVQRKHEQELLVQWLVSTVTEAVKSKQVHYITPFQATVCHQNTHATHTHTHTRAHTRTHTHTILGGKFSTVYEGAQEDGGSCISDLSQGLCSAT